MELSKMEENMPKDTVPPEAIYKELGLNYRFFLGWRHALLAGHVVILGAILLQTYNALESIPKISGFIPLFGIGSSIIILKLEDRIQDLYRAAIGAGIVLEGKNPGFFTAVNTDSKKTTHSTTLTKTYEYSSIFMGVISIVILIITLLGLCVK